MSFEWDENKRLRNIARHGVDFIAILPLFDDPMSEVLADNRQHYDEDRFILLGFLQDKLYQVVFTSCGDTIRIISARRASRQERKLYDRFKHH